MICFVLFRNGHFHNVVLTFTKFVKLDVENDNVVSMLSDVVHINVEIHNIDSTLFDVANSNVNLTMSHVATSYHPKDNVETTLKCFLGRGVLLKKVCLKNFAKFTGKHMCQSHIFNKVKGDPGTNVFL